jgi:hypothetical protein
MIDKAILSFNQLPYGAEIVNVVVASTVKSHSDWCSE